MPADLYQEWLQIPSGPRPPDHYTLLGLAAFEADAEKIHQAAAARLRHLRQYGLKYPKESTQLLNEVAAAEVCLTDSANKEEYDLGLHVLLPPPSTTETQVHAGSLSKTTQLSPSKTAAVLPVSPHPPLQPETASPAPIPGKDSTNVGVWLGAGAVGILLLALGVLLSGTRESPEETLPTVKGMAKQENSRPDAKETEEPAHREKQLDDCKKKLSDPDMKVRREAIQAIRALRPSPETIIPDLLAAMVDGGSEVVQSAQSALEEIGPPADPRLAFAILREALRHKRTQARGFAGRNLTKLASSLASSPDSRSLVEQIHSAFLMGLQGMDANVARESVVALEKLRLLGKDHLPQLEIALKSPHGEIRLFAILSMLQISTDQADIEKAVGFALGADEPGVLGAIVKNAQKIGVNKILPLLTKALQSQEQDIAQGAVEELREGPIPADLFADLKKAQKSPHTFVRVFVVQSLNWPELDAKTIGAFIKLAMKDPESAVKDASEKALIERLKDDKEEIRLLAVTCLESLGKEVTDGDQLLVDVLSDKSERIRIKALSILRKTGLGAKKAISRLRSLLGRSEEEARAAAETFISIGADAALQDALKNGSQEVWVRGCKALFQIAPKGEGILERALDQKIQLLGPLETRKEAVKALAAMGAPIVPRLVPLLKKNKTQEERNVRWGAVILLGEIGPNVLKSPKGEEAIEALKGLFGELGAVSRDAPSAFQKIKGAK